MNYYNPYYGIPYSTLAPTARPGLIRGLLGGAKSINFSSLLSNTSRVLNIANQAIPVVKQITPVLKNAKTMFKVMNEFKKIDEPKVSSSKVSNSYNYHKNLENSKSFESNIGPTFFA